MGDEIWSESHRRHFARLHNEEFLKEWERKFRNFFEKLRVIFSLKMQKIGENEAIRSGIKFWKCYMFACICMKHFKTISKFFMRLKIEIDVFLMKNEINLNILWKLRQ